MIRNTFGPLVQRVILGLSCAALLLATIPGCAVNPATGKRQISLVSESQEISMGQEYDPSIVASFGLYPDESLQQYIDGLGQDLAEVSERPQLPWTFRLVDDSAVNAFAVPGGFIYVTRGIMAALNSEAELVGVMGHEVGHITARHSVNQITRQQLSQIGFGVGMIVSGEFRKYGEAIMQGLEVMNLSYSRGDESQSDELGVRYMTRVDYDPNALIGVMKTLAIVSGGSGRLPEWQLTHPYPENRETNLKQLIAASGVDYSDNKVDRDGYLRRLDGMVYGPNPREGYFKGSLFHHPDMRFRLSFPAGWKGVNQKTVVGAISPEEDAIMMLTLAPEAAGVDDAMTAFKGQEGIEVGAVSSDSVNRLAARSAQFTAQSQGNAIQGVVTFIAYDGNVYQLMGYGSASSWPGNGSVVTQAIRTFQKETDRAVLAVQPAQLKIVSLPSSMFFTEFMQKYPSSVPDEEVADINRFVADERLNKGMLVKRVVGGELP